jgi:hypothetical protein
VTLKMNTRHAHLERRLVALHSIHERANQRSIFVPAFPCAVSPSSSSPSPPPSPSFFLSLSTVYPLGRLWPWVTPELWKPGVPPTDDFGKGGALCHGRVNTAVPVGPPRLSSITHPAATVTCSYIDRTESGGIAANAGPRVPSGGVTLKRRCTYRPSVIYLNVNKLFSLSLSLSLARARARALQIGMFVSSWFVRLCHFLSRSLALSLSLQIASL